MSREIEVFNLSFIDLLACGLGSVLLLLLIFAASVRSGTVVLPLERERSARPDEPSRRVPLPEGATLFRVVWNATPLAPLKFECTHSAGLPVVSTTRLFDAARGGSAELLVRQTGPPSLDGWSVSVGYPERNDLEAFERVVSAARLVDAKGLPDLLREPVIALAALPSSGSSDSVTSRARTRQLAELTRTVARASEPYGPATRVVSEARRLVRTRPTFDPEAGAATVVTEVQAAVSGGVWVSLGRRRVGHGATEVFTRRRR